MLVEYIKYAYNNLFRFPRRFIAVVIGVSLATFGILSLFSITTNLQKMNIHIIDEIENSDVNNNQLLIQSQTLDNPIDLEKLNDILGLDGVENGYYYEDFSYYLWQYNYLIPWIKLDNKLNIELKPILLDSTSAKNYGLEEKIIAGGYFSSNPNEIILSKDILGRFLDESKVFKDNDIILPEKTRQEIRQLSSESINPNDYIGKEVLFTYHFQFELDKTDPTDIHYRFSNPIHIPLKIVGIYDPSLGFKTVGDVWLPLSLKESLVGLDSTSSLSDMGKQVSIRVSKANQLESVKDNVSELGYFAIPTLEEKPFVSNQLLQRNVHRIFYEVALIIAIAISAISLIVIIALMISDRKYDFYLQRALGASNKQILFFFISEMFFITWIGTLIGLFLTLLFLQSKLDTLLQFNFYLNGNLTLFVITAIPFVSVIFAIIQLHLVLNTQVSIGLSREGS